ncbi:MAG: DMT family transporter [Saprospiraceae bacterium]
MTERLRGVIAITFAALAWSTAGLFIKWLDFDAFTILCVRAFYTMMVFLLVFRGKVFALTWPVVRVAFFYAALVITFVTSTKMTTAANAIFLQYTGVAYVLLLEPLLFRLPYQRINIITTVVCFAGMALFFMDGLDIQGAGIGLLIAALSGLAYAGFVLGQRFNAHTHHEAAIFWGNFLVFFIGMPSFLDAPTFTVNDHLMLAFLGVIQLGLGYVLFTYGLKRTTATEASLITMLEPLFNPVWVAIGYGELPGISAVIGGLIILAALSIRVLLLRRMRRL